MISISIYLIFALGLSSANISVLKVTQNASFGIEENQVNEIGISVLCLGGDTILVASGIGLWGQFDREKPWRKLIDCINFRETEWYDACSEKDEWNQFYDPNGMWRTSTGNEIVIFDDFCNCLFKLNLENNSKHYLTHWNEWHWQGGVHFQNFSFYGERIISGISPLKKKLVAIGQTDRKDYIAIFEPPELLDTRLDSTGIKGLVVNPVYNPIDSSIWVAGYGFENVYIINTEGKLLDSIALTASDFRLPSPPISRVQSRAVFFDWLSKWTPITSINYVPTGHILLQYRIGYEKLGNDSIPLYSTIVWTADRQRIELEVNRHWQVAGVQPDGRVIFAHYQLDGEKIQIVLDITRLEP